MVDYAEESLNSFLLRKQRAEAHETIDTIAFDLSSYEILGKGDARAKIIIRLKLEELISYDGFSSSKYIRRMPSLEARKEWLGFLATREIGASCLCCRNHILYQLQLLKDWKIVLDRKLTYKNLKVKKHGSYPFSTRVHMWKIHNPLPEKLYQLARFKLNREDPAELFRRFKERVTKYGSFVITKK